MKRWKIILAFVVTACGNGDRVVLEVEVNVPGHVPTITSGVLYLSLWSYDPGIADVGATLVDQDVAAFSHVAGEHFVVRMRVAGRVADPRRHYISVEGCAGTLESWNRILWDGLGGTQAPRVVEMHYLPVGGGTCSFSPLDS